MKKIGIGILAAIFMCATLGAATPADAKPRKQTHHAVHHGKKVGAAKARIRRAQTWLNELGYDCGKADGIVGKRTRAALKEFQREHDLFTTGKLTDATYDALEKAAQDKEDIDAGREDFYTARPDFYGHVAQDYTDPNQLTSPQPIPSRFGNLQIAVEAKGAFRQYTITLDNQPIMQAQNQPAPVAISQTFSLGHADLVLITSHDTSNITCPYKHHLLAMLANTHHVYEIQNCTQAVKTRIAGETLLISFPDASLPGGTGNMWRYENGLLIKL